MELPPPDPLAPPPPAPKRFGRAILISVLAPMVPLALGMAVAGGLQIKDAEGYFWIVFLVGCLCSVVGAAYICVAATGSVVGRVFIFTISGAVLLVVYTFSICAGCSAVSGPLNFH